MKLHLRIYSIYCMLLFVVLFIIFLVPFLIIIPVKRWHKYTYIVNCIWARCFFTLCFIRVKIEGTENFKPGQNYILCANHFSYMDIPVMGYTWLDFVFVGKSSISKAPLFGYMFKKLHITVDRSNFRDRYKAFEKGAAALSEGRSLLIFPEGGIVTKNPPEMGRFKEGAFRLAIENQIPIIPVSIPYNWLILPDKGELVLHPRKLRVIIKKPIETKGLTMDDLESIKAQTYACIDESLKELNKSRISQDKDQVVGA